MRPLPENELDPRVKNVWRINDALWLTFTAAGVIALLQLFGLSPHLEGLVGPATTMAIGAYAACLIVWLAVLPPIRYLRWRYQVTPEYLDIAKGIIWRKRYIIPFVRVQNTDTRQGPILRLFGLASVTVSTAAGEHEIPGLDYAVADELRDRAAEFARLAREDV